jgi:pantothenate synthetase
LGGAGVLFHEKDFESLAEVVDMLVRDQRLRKRIIRSQTDRVQDFMALRVRQQWQGYLEKLALL